MSKLPNLKNLEKEFLNVINENNGIIYKVSRIYIDNEIDREDLVQEIVYQLWKSYDGFQGKSKFSTWMYKIALNTAILYFKKEKKFITNNAQFANVSEKVDHITNQEEEITMLYNAIQKLEKIEKALIFLYLEGLSNGEISKNLGISEVNTRVKLHRAKEKIKIIIQNQQS